MAYQDLFQESQHRVSWLNNQEYHLLDYTGHRDAAVWIVSSNLPDYTTFCASNKFLDEQSAPKHYPIIGDNGVLWRANGMATLIIWTCKKYKQAMDGRQIITKTRLLNILEETLFKL